jgi:hypothetical protein
MERLIETESWGLAFSSTPKPLEVFAGKAIEL